MLVDITCTIYGDITSCKFLLTSNAVSPAASECSTISPRVLAIGEDKPSRITCSTATSACQDVINVYFTNPSIGVFISQEKRFNDIVNFTSDHNNCLYSLDISWTRNEERKRELALVQCIFIYSNTTSRCETKNATISFLGKL